MFDLKRFSFVRRFLNKPLSVPTQVNHRAEDQKVALVFLHGFSGHPETTWSCFIPHILRDPSVQTWDVFSLGYPSSLRIDVPNVWAADPSIQNLARGLRTTLSLPPFDRYQRIAIAAHSMGGLIVERVILDDPKLLKRLSHVFLFGTPSGGLSKALPFSLFKRQIRDMLTDSSFVSALRREWSERFGAGTPFRFWVVAGDRDEFVPAQSSLAPFPEEVRAVVPGNHLEIVKPFQNDHQSVILLISALCGRQQSRSVVDGARLAIELGNFHAAVEALLPHADIIDETALGSLALALDGLGRGKEALQVLERRCRTGQFISTDALGILAGRLKRRWLLERAIGDLNRARELYENGLHQAEIIEDYNQASYHAINIAFLELMSSPDDFRVPETVRTICKRAEDYCLRAKQTHWIAATQGEARLMLEDLHAAETYYAKAIASAESPRHIDLMYVQAISVAARVFGGAGIKCIERVFGFPTQ